MHRMLILTLTSMALVPAYAQDRPEPFRLPPVIVDAPPVESGVKPDRRLTEEEAREELERTPGGVGFVGEDEIEGSRAFNEKDVLNFVPGVLIRPRFGAEESQISIRGSGLRNNFHVRGVNILIDGFAINNADGFGVFGLLELLSAKRIEVYKGASALRLGANTLGGAINVVTKTGYDAGLLEARGEVGSYGFLKGYLATGQVYEPLDFYLAGSDTELFDNYRDHGEQARRRIYSNIGYQLPGGTTVRLDLNYVKNDEELPGSLTREEFEDDPRQANPGSVLFDERHDYDYYRTALTVRTPLTGNQALEFNAQFNILDLDHPLSFAVLTGNTYNVSGELRYLSAAPLFDHGNRLTVGIQLAYTNQEDVRFENNMGERGEEVRDQNNKATNVAIYAEDQFDATDNLMLTVGSRLQYSRRSVSDNFFTDEDSQPDDSDSTDFFSITPKVGFIWNIAPTVQVFGNASGAYEPPLLLELTSPGQLDGDLGDLKAQKGVQFELGTRGQFADRITWDVSVYDIELWDEIQNVNILPFPDAPFTIPRFQNIDRSRHTGVEVGLSLILLEDLVEHIGLSSSGDTLGIRTAYTYSRFVFVDDPEFGDNDIPGAPSHFIVSELRYDNPSGFWIAPGIESVPSGYFVDSENTEETDPYILFNVQTGYTYKPWNLSLFFEVRNAFDEDYISSVVVDSADGRFFEPGDGRALYAGLQWGWNR
jgi:iron complex outermembrane receptor protein